MCRKLSFLVSLVFVLSLVSSAWAQSPGDLELLSFYKFDDPSLDFQEDSGPQEYHIYHDGWMIGYYGGVSFDGPGYESPGAYTPDYGEYDGDSDSMEYAPFIYIPGDVWPNGSEEWTVDFMVNFGLDPWVDEPDIYGHDEEAWWPWHHQCPFVAESVFNFLEWQGSVTDFDTMLHDISLNLYSDSTYTGTDIEIPIADEWHHYCISVTATRVLQFFDGELVQDWSGSFANGTNCSALYIGAGGWEWYMFAAKIDNFRIWEGWTATPPALAGVVVLSVSNETPEHEGTGVRPDTDLCWEPPSIAGCRWIDAPDGPCTPPDVNLCGPIYYDVWFGTEPNILGNMTQIVDDMLDMNCVDPCCVDPCEFDLDPATTYYWRVDINDHNDCGGGGTPVIYEGPYFSFTTWGYAYNISPEDGATEVDPDADLYWEYDGFATTGDLYFGEAGNLQQKLFVSAAETYDPGPLNLGTEYCWQIDEVNGVTIPGVEWCYTTAECALIDDMEAYNDNLGPHINTVWLDWNTYNTNASTYTEDSLGYESMTDGNSLMIDYDTSGFVRSETKKLWGTNQDWTTRGATGLVLWILGDAGNVAGPYEDLIYVGLDDADGDFAAVVLDVNTLDLDPCNWTPVEVALQDFNDLNDVNPEKIRSLHIGIVAGGDLEDPCEGGWGYIYVDNIEVCAPYCRSEFYPEDYVNEDCIVNYEELGDMVALWLQEDSEVEVEAPIKSTVHSSEPFGQTSPGI